MRLPKLLVETDERSTVTPFGGLALYAGFVKRFGVARRMDRTLNLLKVHLPFHESDHILAMAATLFVGGTCLEDQALLQTSEAACRILGAARIPDPTTAGDFLRRFDRAQSPAALAGLRRVLDELGADVGRAVRKKRGRLPWATVDLDGHYKELYGAQKEGADFNYKRKWSYHPLVASLSETGEVLAVRNRPGNARSSEGAAEVLDEILPLLKGRAERYLVRGDSDFDRQDVREACERHGAYFAIVGREQTGRPEIARAIDDSAFRPFETRAGRAMETKAKAPGFKARRRKANRRKKRARERGYKEKKLVEQQIAEVEHRPTGSNKTYRLIVRRQLIKNYEGQRFLFDQYRYRYVVTNLPGRAEDVIDQTYQRCDQENLIEQLGSGIAAWRMPVAEFDGNSAWLEIARLAWNIGKWLALLVLPDEARRWEWKRFRLAFIYVAAQVLRRSRQVTVRISASHRFHRLFTRALEQLHL